MSSCPAPSIAEVLRLLGGGANGPILVALGEGPMRTKDLARRVSGYTPRSVHRYLGKLTDLGIVEREAEEQVPSRVLLRLANPQGRELYELLARFAEASRGTAPVSLDACTWTSLPMVAGLWESGMFETLSRGPRSSTDLSRGLPGISYHQVNRRAGKLSLLGLLHEESGHGRRKLFTLTDKARRATALIAGVGAWRRRNEGSGAGEMTSFEVRALLRAALPLARVREHAGKSLGLVVSDGEGSAEAAVLAETGDDGAIRIHSNGRPADADGWLRGSTKDWLLFFTAGNSGSLSTDGDEPLVRDSIDRVYRTLWLPDTS